MRLVLSLLLAAVSVLAQEPEEKPWDAAHKSMRAPGYVANGGGAVVVPGQSYWDRIFHHEDWTKVHIDFDPAWGVKEPIFVWLNDENDPSLASDPKILKLEPQGMDIQAKRGHLIFWRVGHR